MSNMSYCRYQNTLADLRDCWEAIREEWDDSELSREEAKAKAELVRLCARIAENSAEDYPEPSRA